MGCVKQLQYILCSLSQSPENYSTRRPLGLCEPLVYFLTALSATVTDEKCASVGDRKRVGALRHDRCRAQDADQTCHILPLLHLVSSGSGQVSILIKSSGPQLNFIKVHLYEFAEAGRPRMKTWGSGEWPPSPSQLKGGTGELPQGTFEIFGVNWKVLKALLDFKI